AGFGLLALVASSALIAISPLAANSDKNRVLDATKASRPKPAVRALVHVLFNPCGTPCSGLSSGQQHPDAIVRLATPYTDRRPISTIRAID
ncbi:MAG: hypothetical protein AAGJ70_09025, partial [Pseudomonadota bacterium]